MDDGNVIFETPNMRVTIVVDQDARNPMTEFQRASHVICRNKGMLACVPVDDLQYVMSRFHSELVCARWLRIFHGAFTIIDGCNVWYIIPAELDPADRPMAQQILEDERQEFIDWANGEVYGYIIEKLVTYQRVDEPNVRKDIWETVDSCYGFYGLEYCRAAAMEAVNH